MYWLDILNGPARGRRKIQRRSLVLGSDLSCQFWVDAPGVAPRHAEIVERAGAVVLRLLARAPSERLKLNGEIVAGERLLSDGDTIEIAGVRIRYRARLPWVERAAPALRWGIPLAMVLGGLGWWGGRWWMRETAKQAGATRSSAIEPMTAPAAEPALVTSAEPPRLARMEALGEAVQAAASSPKAPSTNTENPVELPPPIPAPPAETPSLSSDGEPAAEATVAMRLPTESDAKTSSLPVAAGQSGEVAPAVAERAPTTVESAFEPQIKAAEALGQAGAWDRALSLVAEVPPTDSGYARVLAVRARAAEEAGRWREAEALWTDVLRVGSGTPLYETAFRELIRLAERQVSLAPPPLLERAAMMTGSPPARVSPPPVVPESVLDAMRSARPPPAASPPIPEPPAVERTSPTTASVASRPPATTPPGETPRPEPSWPLLRTNAAAIVDSERRAATAASAPSPGPASGPGQTEAPRPAATAAAPSQVTARVAPAVAEARTSPLFSVVRADMTRFPADEGRDDFRVLNVQFRLEGGREPIPLDRLAVELTFFDRAGDPPQVFASRIARGAQRYQLTGAPWRPGEVRQLTFSYTVPKGAREREYQEYGVAAAYHGYRLRIIYEGQVVLVHARPSDLADLR